MKKTLLLSILLMTTIFIVGCKTQSEIINDHGSDNSNRQVKQLLEENKKLQEQIHDLKSEKVEDGKEVEITDESYQEVIDYISQNITEILQNSSSLEATNGSWYSTGYGFTSINDVYVDFEDGHYMHRALLACTETCEIGAVFEKKHESKDTWEWEVIEGEDTQKENPIVHKWAMDYEWERYNNSSASNLISNQNLEDSWKHYENTEYGFSLEFPNEWEGYSIEETKNPIELKESSIKFGDRFSIGVYKQSNWPLPSTHQTRVMIGENTDYIFTFSGPHDIDPDYPERDATIGDVRTSIKTFEPVS